MTLEAWCGPGVGRARQEGCEAGEEQRKEATCTEAWIGRPFQGHGWGKAEVTLEALRGSDVGATSRVQERKRCTAIRRLVGRCKGFRQVADCQIENRCSCLQFQPWLVFADDGLWCLVIGKWPLRFPVPLFKGDAMSGACAAQQSVTAPRFCPLPFRFCHSPFHFCPSSFRFCHSPFHQAI